ncbi:ribonuclease P protein component [Prevotella sp. CAG:474]|uniref:ribonuclease P protein component n=1 Tax=Prevotella dentalis TaxID=52227 RepID=UPI00033D668E|nr:ribonuclease P protein component [Prevotella dentalis]MCF2636204.1 ribonuclease P protein component [Prevotella dentalis]CDC96923.1 ribonuclease P protein component [Prevotella sp. CAG:474]
MSAAERFTLSKEERICSKKLINELFTGNGRSMTAFPLRVVFMKRTIVDDQPRAAMLVSVPKRYFKHAVDRNRVKRQVREAFRRNKSIITQNLTDDHDAVAMAFVWLTNEKYPSSEVENRMVRLLTRISECL